VLLLWSGRVLIIKATISRARWHSVFPKYRKKMLMISTQMNSLKKIRMDNVCFKNRTNVYVSAIVPTQDDPSTPSLTARVLFLGTLWNMVLAAANSIFMFRTNPFSIPSTVATLLCYPMGIMMARYLPTKMCKIGSYEFTLNPGPFSIKEHVLISIIASSGGMRLEI
jgi:hypothetical protein